MGCSLHMSSCIFEYYNFSLTKSFTKGKYDNILVFEKNIKWIHTLWNDCMYMFKSVYVCSWKSNIPKRSQNGDMMVVFPSQCFKRRALSIEHILDLLLLKLFCRYCNICQLMLELASIRWVLQSFKVLSALSIRSPTCKFLV